MNGILGMGKSILTSMGIIDKPKAEYKLKNGVPEADIDYSNVDPDQKARVKKQANEIARGMHNLDQEIKNEPDLAKREALEAKKEELQNAFTEFKHQVETPEVSGWELGLMVGVGLATGGVGAIVVDGIIDTHSDNKNIDESFKVAQGVGADTQFHAMSAPAPEGGPGFVEGNTKQSYGSGGESIDMSGAGGLSARRRRELRNSKADGVAMKLANPDAEDQFTPEELMFIMRTDPGKFQQIMTKLGKENATAAQVVMQSIKTHMQEQDRFWGLMSSVENADHQTKKNIISNFRV